MWWCWQRPRSCATGSHTDRRASQSCSSVRITRTLIDRYREGSSNLLLNLTLVAPLRGRVVPIVGIGGLVVGGAAATALLRSGLPPLAVVTTIAAGLLGALAYGLVRGGAPALPFVAVAVFVLVRWHQVHAGASRNG